MEGVKICIFVSVRYKRNTKFHFSKSEKQAANEVKWKYYSRLRAVWDEVTSFRAKDSHIKGTEILALPLLKACGFTVLTDC